MCGINDLTFEELERQLQEMNLPKFQAKQIYSWLGKGVRSFDEMRNLSKELKERLAEKYMIKSVEIEKKFPSAIDETVKYLIRLQDDNYVEAVVMKYHHGNTVCLSTQVGCRMGCAFCASTIGGLVRNLTAGEMLMQIFVLQEDLGERISNIVLMGMGEPLDNYDQVIAFLKNVNHPLGLNIGFRHITLSTCGLVNQINRLAEENLPITLSVSLHAPDDETRQKIMPIDKKYKIEQLIEACKKYIAKTNRRITFEYILIDGVNDSVKQAEQLAALLKGMLCHVNLIPANEVEETGLKKSNPKAVKTFLNRLSEKGIKATVRRELGKDIDASCGQLRKRKLSGDFSTKR